MISKLVLFSIEAWFCKLALKWRIHNKNKWTNTRMKCEQRNGTVSHSNRRKVIQRRMLRSDRVSKSQNVHLNDVYLCINNMLRLKSSDVMHISCGRSFQFFVCFCYFVVYTPLWNSEIVLQINQKYVTFKIYYDRRRFERKKRSLQLKGSKNGWM